MKTYEPHDRKCETCSSMFVASCEDQKLNLYKCVACRKIKATRDMRPPERGEFNPYPTREIRKARGK
jgi:hypothetical protein